MIMMDANQLEEGNVAAGHGTMLGRKFNLSTTHLQ